jgi:hypothetical protein
MGSGLPDVGPIGRRRCSHCRGSKRNPVHGILFRAPPGDIAVGADGSAWVIGTQALGNDYSIHKWDEPSRSWTQSDGAAIRTAVGPDGVPWVINSSQAIYQRTSNSPTSGGWGQPLSGLAYELDVNGAL